MAKVTATIQQSEVFGYSWQCTNCALSDGKTIYFYNDREVDEHMSKHGKVVIEVESPYPTTRHRNTKIN